MRISLLPPRKTFTKKEKTISVLATAITAPMSSSYILYSWITKGTILIEMKAYIFAFVLYGLFLICIWTRRKILHILQWGMAKFYNKFITKYTHPAKLIKYLTQNKFDPTIPDSSGNHKRISHRFGSLERNPANIIALDPRGLRPVDVIIWKDGLEGRNFLGIEGQITSWNLNGLGITCRDNPFYTNSQTSAVQIEVFPVLRKWNVVGCLKFREIKFSQYQFAVDMASAPVTGFAFSSSIDKSIVVPCKKVNKASN